ncbi:MAG: hypothetical protein J7647_17370 [Cyanobacteria bacterium SBLK]|nr:hypothetical protein [Cyanobacteria bacterium SBLK]
MMNDCSEPATDSFLFLHHFSLDEKTKIFQECQRTFNRYKDNIIQQTKERVQKQEGI